MAVYIFLLAVQPVVSFWELYAQQSDPCAVTCCQPQQSSEAPAPDDDCCRNGWKCNPTQHCMKCPGFVPASVKDMSEFTLHFAEHTPVVPLYHSLLNRSEIWHPPRTASSLLV
jgi:hypothetical protein